MTTNPVTTWYADAPGEGLGVWPEYLHEVHLADSITLTAEHPPVGVPFRVFFDGEDVTHRLPNGEITASAMRGARETRLMLGFFARDIEIEPVDDEHHAVKVLGRRVLTPPVEDYPLPERHAAAASPDDVVHVVLQVARVTFGGAAAE